MNIKELEDRIFLRELVDVVSILGDRKDFKAQVQQFSENAVSETFAGDTAILKLKGRNEMEEAFGSFLKDVEIIHHFNGQQVVNIDGNSATGTCYCLITLIGTEHGKKMKTSISAIYHDDYVRENKRWLIAKRIGNFEWQEKSEVNL